MTTVRTTRAIPTFGGVVPAGSVGVLFQRDRGFVWLRFDGREVHGVAASAIEKWRPCDGTRR